MAHDEHPSGDNPFVECYLQSLLASPETLITAVDRRDEMFADTEYAFRGDRNRALCSYFGAGKEIFDAIAQIVRWKFGGFENVSSFLDFAAGYGRSTRFLVRELPAERVWVSDISADAVQFQRDAFGGHGLLSQMKPENFVCERRFDCIVVVSLFSHLPERTFVPWLRTLYGLLQDSASCLVFSTHGPSANPNVVIPASGFWFEQHSENKTLSTKDYGSTFVTEAFVREAIRRATGGEGVCRRLPRGLCRFQDLYVVVRDEPPALTSLGFWSAPVARLETCALVGTDTLRLGGWTGETTPDSPIEEIQVRINGTLVRKCKLHNSGFQCSCPAPDGGSFTGPETLTLKAAAGNGFDFIFYHDTVEQAILERPEEELARTLLESGMLAAENERLTRELQHLREISKQYAAIRRSLSWRVTAPLRTVAGWALATRRLLGRREAVAATGPLVFDEANYRQWVERFDRLTDEDRRAIRVAIGKLTHRPVFSLLLAVEDPSEESLRKTMQSIRRQLYREWEICVVDDASTAPHVPRALASCGDDPRIRITRRQSRGGVAASGNDALAMAQGEFVAFLDAGDVLAESALFEIAAEFDAHPDAAIVYSDEDSLDARGERCAPRFKTGWNPDLLLAEDYMGRLAVYNRELAARIGGLRNEFAGACHYDLALRATGVTAASDIRHVAAVLCHRPSLPDAYDAEASRRAVQDRVGNQALVEAAPGAAHGHRVRWCGAEPRVSAIVPTRDRADLLERCVEGLLQRTKYGALDVIVVDNGSREDRTARLFAQYKGLKNVQVLPHPGEFNWSAMNNAGAELATGDILLFLNNDTKVMDQDWLRELAVQAARPEVGAVGAKLLFPDGTLQNAGIWLGPAGYARHLLRLSARRDEGYCGQLMLARNLSAVTGACMAMRCQVFREAGGFDESLPVSYGDVDFCLRLVERGYRIVWTPHAELLHLESASRGSNEWRIRKEEAEREKFLARWQRETDNDPFFNPNLELIGEEKLALAFPPRQKRAWQR